MSKCPRCNHRYSNKAEFRLKFSFKLFIYLSIAVTVSYALYVGFSYTKTYQINIDGGTEVINLER